MRTLKEVAISSFMAFLKNNGFHVPTIAEERLMKQHNEVKKGGRQKGPKIQKQPGRCFLCCCSLAFSPPYSFCPWPVKVVFVESIPVYRLYCDRE